MRQTFQNFCSIQVDSSRSTVQVLQVLQVHQVLHPPAPGSVLGAFIIDAGLMEFFLGEAEEVTRRGYYLCLVAN